MPHDQSSFDSSNATFLPMTDPNLNHSREAPLVAEHTALLFIDVQNYCAHRDGAEFDGLAEADFECQYGWYFDNLESIVIPNMQKLQTAFRQQGIEILYTTIESLTCDGRDRSLDYKISGFHVPKGSWNGQVIDQLVPADDEIWLRKTSSSVFISTNIDYVLRNLEVHQLVISGLLSDQCVESAIRDACDLGYLVTQATDACMSINQERHDHSVSAIRGYCRQRTTSQIIEELATIRHRERTEN